jgi:hypothetical protein
MRMPGIVPPNDRPCLIFQPRRESGGVFLCLHHGPAGATRAGAYTSSDRSMRPHQTSGRRRGAHVPRPWDTRRLYQFRPEHAASAQGESVQKRQCSRCSRHLRFAGLPHNTSHARGTLKTSAGTLGGRAYFFSHELLQIETITCSLCCECEGISVQHVPRSWDRTKKHRTSGTLPCSRIFAGP